MPDETPGPTPGSSPDTSPAAAETVEAAAGAAPVRKRNPKVQMAKEPYGPVALPMGYDEICGILPHRYPFLLVDKIVELEPGVRCVGVKNVTASEDFVQGHFPGHPIMPGVLLLEAMAQVAGILTLVSRNTPGALSYFAAIDNARFRQPVRPGDQMVTEATLEILRGPYCKVNVVGRVDGQIVVEADCTFMTSSDGASNSVTAQKIISSAPVVSLAPQARVSGSPVAAPVSSTPASSNGSASTSPSAPVAPAPFAAPRTHEGPSFVHPTALVDSGAKLAPGVWVGPFCIIEGGVEIGSGTILESHVTVKSGTSIGARCRIWPHCVLGGEPQDGKFKGEDSRLVIGDDNQLREMVTIHRATGEGKSTTIGDKNLLMAYVHIGHNCAIGSHNLISNSTGIAGHVTVEDRVVIGGFVGVHQFVHIGKMAMVGGLSKVVQDVPPFCMADGRPAKTRGLLNIRGLRRSGVSPEERTHVASAVKLLFRSNLNTSEALERVRAEVPSGPTVDYLINFIERVGEGKLGRQDESSHL
jgi:UDP-N-acetylglucosamine acyltransferase